MKNPELLDHTFAALADPTRRAILARLARGGTTVEDLAEPFEISLPAISRHLKVLQNAGLIANDRCGQHHLCRINPERLAVACEWLEPYRKLAEQRSRKRNRL